MSVNDDGIGHWLKTAVGRGRTTANWAAGKGGVVDVEIEVGLLGPVKDQEWLLSTRGGVPPAQLVGDDSGIVRIVRWPQYER